MHMIGADSLHKASVKKKIMLQRQTGGLQHWKIQQIEGLRAKWPSFLKDYYLSSFPNLENDCLERGAKYM